MLHATSSLIGWAHTETDPWVLRLEHFRQTSQIPQESGVLYFQQQQKVTVHSVNNTNINAIEI